MAEEQIVMSWGKSKLLSCKILLTGHKTDKISTLMVLNTILVMSELSVSLEVLVCCPSFVDYNDRKFVGLQNQEKLGGFL